MSKPVVIEPDVHNGVVPTQTSAPNLARNDLFRRTDPIHMHVEVECLFPHGWNEHKMPLLTEILLRDLQFDGLARLLHGAEKRRGRFSHLKIDRPMFDLYNDVVLK